MKSVRWKRIELTYPARIQLPLAFVEGRSSPMVVRRPLVLLLIVVQMRVVVHLRANVRWEVRAGCLRFR